MESSSLCILMVLTGLLALVLESRAANPTIDQRLGTLETKIDSLVNKSRSECLPKINLDIDDGAGLLSSARVFTYVNVKDIIMQLTTEEMTRISKIDMVKIVAPHFKELLRVDKITRDMPDKSIASRFLQIEKNNTLLRQRLVEQKNEWGDLSEITFRMSRLAPAVENSYYRLVQVFVLGGWKNLCMAHINEEVARVMCGPNFKFVKIDGQGTGAFNGGRVLLKNLRCTGYESKLAKCSYDGILVNQCKQSYNAAVFCTNVDL